MNKSSLFSAVLLIVALVGGVLYFNHSGTLFAPAPEPIPMRILINTDASASPTIDGGPLHPASGGM